MPLSKSYKKIKSANFLLNTRLKLYPDELFAGDIRFRHKPNSIYNKLILGVYTESFLPGQHDEPNSKWDLTSENYNNFVEVIFFKLFMFL